MNTDFDVWQAARDLARRMRQVTGIMAERLDRGELEDLSSLLNERQEICEQLDKLRTEHGIASWVAGNGLSDSLPEGAGAAKEEIGEIFRWLMAEDERLRRKLEERMLAVKKDLGHVKKMRQAHRLYTGGTLFPYGAFIDSRR